MSIWSSVTRPEVRSRTHFEWDAIDPNVNVDVATCSQTEQIRLAMWADTSHHLDVEVFLLADEASALVALLTEAIARVRAVADPPMGVS